MRKCKYCDREFTHAGGHNLHQIQCELKHLRELAKSNLEEPKKERGRETASDYNRGCQHEFRLLRANDRAEYHAIQNGFKEVCELCQELR